MDSISGFGATTVPSIGHGQITSRSTSQPTPTEPTTGIDVVAAISAPTSNRANQIRSTRRESRATLPYQAGDNPAVSLINPETTFGWFRDKKRSQEGHGARPCVRFQAGHRPTFGDSRRVPPRGRSRQFSFGHLGVSPPVGREPVS